MPNIENLRKQAKQYLRWHRERYYPVAPQIRAALPRFRHSSDEQILDANFKLADAQELVAPQLGFGGQALKSGADAMIDEPRETTPRPILNSPILSSISAQLFVANIKSSCDFYTNKLGFAVEFVYGDPPYYGQVSRDHARLKLESGLRTRVHWRYSRARASTLSYHHGCHRERNQTTVSDLSGCRSLLPSGT